jgi:putative DNA primase/helicase
MDVLGMFIEERCVVREGAQVGATPLYNAYQNWCKEMGEEVLTQTAFGRSLGERGYKREKSGTVTWYGIGLRDG